MDNRKAVTAFLTYKAASEGAQRGDGRTEWCMSVLQNDLSRLERDVWLCFHGARRSQRGAEEPRLNRKSHVHHLVSVFSQDNLGSISSYPIAKKNNKKKNNSNCTSRQHLPFFFKTTAKDAQITTAGHKRQMLHFLQIRSVLKRGQPWKKEVSLWFNQLSPLLLVNISTYDVIMFVCECSTKRAKRERCVNRLNMMINTMRSKKNNVREISNFARGNIFNKEAHMNFFCNKTLPIST